MWGFDYEPLITLSPSDIAIEIMLYAKRKRDLTREVGSTTYPPTERRFTLEPLSRLPGLPTY